MANEPQYTKAEATKAAKEATAAAKQLYDDADNVGNTRLITPAERAIGNEVLQAAYGPQPKQAPVKEPKPSRDFQASMERTLAGLGDDDEKPKAAAKPAPKPVRTAARDDDGRPENLIPAGFNKPAANRGGFLIPAATPPEGYGVHPETIGHINADKKAVQDAAPRGGTFVPASKGLSATEASLQNITNAIPGGLFGEQQVFNVQVEHHRLSPELVAKAMEAAQVLVQEAKRNPEIHKAFAKNMDLDGNGKTELKEAAAVALALDEQRTFGKASFKDLSEQLRGANLTKLLLRADVLSEAIEDSLPTKTPDVRVADRGDKSPKM